MLPISDLCRQFTTLWWASDSRQPILGPCYSPAQQASAEHRLGEFIDALNTELEHPPRTHSLQKAARARTLPLFAKLAQSALLMEAGQTERLPSEVFADAALDFVQQARRFDPRLSHDDVYQANRNMWVVNCLQFLLGLPVRVTPAALAYSLLYPYSDNYLDDPRLTSAEKIAFNTQFRRRLAGEAVSAANAHEGRIFELVGMIEGQFARADYPQVFASLLAIHAAQARSLQLQRTLSQSEIVDVVGISVEKGGTSVLADGFLAAGQLSPAQQEFVFGYGVLAQLVDDLEDVHADRRNGRLTVFAEAAASGSLEAVTNRTLNFGARVLDGLREFDSPEVQPLVEVMQRGAALLLILLASQVAELYPRSYLSELEAHSPFRFAFLRQCRQRMAARCASPQLWLEALSVPRRVAER